MIENNKSRKEFSIMTRKNLLQIFETLPEADQVLLQRRLNGEKRYTIAKELGISFNEYRNLERDAWKRFSDLIQKEDLRVHVEGIFAHHKHGFSLPEIMVVVSLIGLMAAFAIPAGMKMRERSQHNERVAKARILREAANLAGLHSAAGRDLTTNDVAYWIRGGYDKLAIDGELPQMPQMDAWEWFLAKPEAIAEVMYEN